MICYRDMSFCTDAEHCPVAETCDRYLSPAHEARANSLGLPVAFMTFKDRCPRYQEATKEPECK